MVTGHGTRGIPIVIFTCHTVPGITIPGDGAEVTTAGTIIHIIIIRVGTIIIITRTDTITMEGTVAAVAAVAALPMIVMLSGRGGRTVWLG